MNRTLRCAIVVIFLGLLSGRAGAASADDGTGLREGAAERLRALTGEYERAQEAFEKASDAAGCEERRRLEGRWSDRRAAFARRFLALARESPAVAPDGLTWILENDAASPAGESAAEAVLRDYADEEKTANLARRLVYFPPSRAAESLLRGLIARPRDVATANSLRLSLATFLVRRADCVRSREREADRTGREPGDDFLRVDAAALTREAEQLLARAGEGRLAAAARKVRREMQIFAVGRVAPEIEGTDIDGRPMRLGDFRGRVVVLKFWGTWCGPCMALVPHDRALVSRLRDRPFALLGVESDDDRPKARRVIEEKGIIWRSWWDGGNNEGPIATAWNVSGLWGWPTFYVLDARGVIRYKHLRGHALDDAVDRLLEEIKEKR